MALEENSYRGISNSETCDDGAQIFAFDEMD